MWIFKSLLFFRCLFIGSIFIFIFTLHKEYLYESSLQISNTAYKTFVSDVLWSSIDVEVPEQLHSSLAERLRLNELFATKQIECKNAHRIADTRQTFVICPEIHNEFKNGLVITGNSFSTGSLEAQLNITNWSIFLPEDSKLIDSLSGDVEVNYLTELYEWDHWHTWDFEQAIKSKTFSFLRFELYSPHFEHYDQPTVIRKLIKLLKSPADYLMITIHVPSDTDNDGKRVLSDWYRLFYWLYLNQKYAIVGAYPSGTCGFQTQSCRYHISLVNYKGQTRLNAPVFGFGSPVEEKKRLILEMTVPKNNCYIINSDEIPFFCSRTLLTDSKVLLIRYGYNLLPDFPETLKKISKIVLIQPSNLETNLTNIDHYQLGISVDGSINSSDQLWKLQTMEEVIKNINTEVIDLILIDVHGSEWDILSQIINILQDNQNNIKILQIAIKGTFYPEENENYRHFYWILTQLTHLGFSKAFSVIKEDTFQISYVYSFE